MQNTKEKEIETGVLSYISKDVYSVLARVDHQQLKKLEEIRLRAFQPLMVLNHAGEWFVDRSGALAQKQPECPLIVLPEDLIRTVELMCENSIYAFQDEIKQGYITLKGGHRVGIVGKVVPENGKVKNIKEFSGINIRISKEVPGCAAHVIRYVLGGPDAVYNTLLISPPQCGKTTMLRDLARILSDGSPGLGFGGCKVGIVDERSELAACCKGVPQNHVGIRTDVLDSCPKAIGMEMLVRAMSPKVIVTDEIGNEGDRNAVMGLLNAGIKILTTAHGYNVSGLQSRKEVLRLIEDQIFERLIVLGNTHGPGTLEEVIDGRDMKVLYQRLG